MQDLRFLLVDDDADDSSLFLQVVSDVNPAIKVDTAVDGYEAVQFLQSGSPAPHLIFLDLNMPRMNGKECLVFIKGTESLKNIPVIMYTTSSLSKDIEDCMINGAACFITKPSGVKELHLIIATLVKGLPGHLQEALQELNDRVDTFIVI